MMMGQTKTGSLLHREHVATIQFLQRLEDFLGRLGNAKAPDVGDPAVKGMLEELAATVDREVGRHFGFEEDHLFPLLSERGEMGIAQFLTYEHGTILPLAKQLAEAAVKAAAEGFTNESWKDFHANGLELVEREIFHIQKEEMGLLAAISMLLDAEADARLAEKYEEVLGGK